MQITLLGIHTLTMKEANLEHFLSPRMAMGVCAAGQKQLLFYYMSCTIMCHASFYINDKNTHSPFVHLTVSELFPPVSAVGTNSLEGDKFG